MKRKIESPEEELRRLLNIYLRDIKYIKEKLEEISKRLKI